MPRQSDLTDLAARYEIPSQIVRLFQELLAVSPATAHALLADLGRATGDWQVEVAPMNRGPKPSRTRGSTAYDSIVDHFVRTNNAPASKEAILKGSGVSEHSLTTILYKRNKADFINDPAGVGGKARVYSLTPTAWERAKEGAPT